MASTVEDTPGAAAAATNGSKDTPAVAADATAATASADGAADATKAVKRVAHPDKPKFEAHEKELQAQIAEALAKVVSGHCACLLLPFRSMHRCVCVTLARCLLLSVLLTRAR